MEFYLLAMIAICAAFAFLSRLFDGELEAVPLEVEPRRPADHEAA